MKSRMTVVFLGSMIACMAASQVFLKLAGSHAATGRLDVLHAFLANTWLWCGLLATGAGFVCWLLTLRNMSLAVAYPWTALIYIITPLASALLFGDVLNGKYVLGMARIVAGVILTTGGVRHHVDSQ